MRDRWTLRKQLSRYKWTPWHLGIALLMVALGVAATIDAWTDIFHIAYVDEEASHIFLVLPVAAWLIWVRRGRLRRCEPRGTFLGPLIVALGWLISTWGYRNSTQSFWHLGAVMVVVGCLASVVGKDLLRRFLPAFLVLVFLVPIPGRLRQRISMPMQRTTAQVTQSIFDVLGISVERSGNQLTINNVPVAIAEACNGLRMVFALALISYAFAFGEPLRNYVRLIILAASPVSAILCNVIRMIPTLLLYGYSSKAVADKFHNVAGWIMLGIAFLLLMAIIRTLRWALIPVTRYTLAST